MTVGSRRWIVVAAAVTCVAAALSLSGPLGAVHPRITVPVVRVSGHNFVNGSGDKIQLRGVNQAGLESQCETGSGIFDPTTMDGNLTVQNAVAAAMVSWGANVVRLTLNEGCWLDEFTSANDPCNPPYGDCGHTVNPVPYEGVAYRNAVINYVKILEQHGLAVILTLAIVSPATSNGTLIPGTFGVTQDLPDSHAVTFWTDVATQFKTNQGVLFDIYGEPAPDSDSDDAAAWACWYSGCPVTDYYGTSSSATYQGVGMKQLVAAIRATGATQPILIAGVKYSGTLGESGAYSAREWLSEVARLSAPGAVVASLHTYQCDSHVNADGECLTSDNAPTGNYYSTCVTQSCWNGEFIGTGSAHTGGAISKYPVVISEFGDYGCSGSYPTTLMDYADGYNLSYVAWAWNPGRGCASDPTLVTGLYGTPTVYGQAVRAHFIARE